MIVVEGPDGAGKTTLISRLSDELQLEVAPRVVSKDAEAMVNLKQWTEDNVREGFQPRIFDRHRLISEPIYGPVLRDAPEPGFDDPYWFRGMMAEFYALEPIVIYCLPPWPVVWKNIVETPDNRIFHDSSQKAYLIWNSYYNKAVTEVALRPLHTIMYNYTADRPGLIFDRVMGRLKTYAQS